MDNSLLAVRDINHKYIVVEKGEYFVNTHTNQQIYKASINNGEYGKSQQELIDLGSIFKPIEFLSI